MKRIMVLWFADDLGRCGVACINDIGERHVNVRSFNIFELVSCCY